MVMKSNSQPFTDVEKLVLELNLLLNRFSWSNEIIEYNMMIWYNEYQGTEVTSEKNQKLHIFSRMGRILFDYDVLNLYSLHEIHPMIIQQLKMMDSYELEKSLKDCWAPIECEKDRIKKYRNLFVAHSKYSAKDFFLIEEFDPSYSDANKKISLAAKCALFYISPILSHLELELGTAYATYHARGGQADRELLWNKEYEEIKQELDIIVKKTADHLMKNGFMPYD